MQELLWPSRSNLAAMDGRRVKRERRGRLGGLSPDAASQSEPGTGKRSGGEGGFWTTRDGNINKPLLHAPRQIINETEAERTLAGSERVNRGSFGPAIGVGRWNIKGRKRQPSFRVR
jgi:hypothetical protein